MQGIDHNAADHPTTGAINPKKASETASGITQNIK
jgi:hypothetical protein